MRKPSLFLLGITLFSLGGSAVTAGCGGDGGSGGSGGGGSGGSGGAGTGGEAPAACFDYATFDGTAPAVSFQADVLPILRNSCGLSSSCHGSETGSGAQHFYGLSKSAGAMSAAQIQAIFDQSVGVPAVMEPAMKVVSAGKPDQSFLMYKLDGDPDADDQLSCETLKCVTDKSCGTAMPQGGPRLPQETRDIVRRWIAQGAKND